jgi:hypothetical protein
MAKIKPSHPHNGQLDDILLTGNLPFVTAVQKGNQ